jgi:hypothetical protein
MIVRKALKTRCALKNSFSNTVYILSVLATCRVCLEDDSTKRTKLLQVLETERNRTQLKLLGRFPLVCDSSGRTSAFHLC